MCNIKMLAEHFGDEEVSKEVDLDMLVKMFFGVMLERFLLPASSSYVTGSIFEAVHDLEKLSDIDWPHLVYEYLNKYISEFAKQATTMDGCVPILMVSTRSYCK